MNNQKDFIKQYEQLHKNINDYGASGSLHFNEVCLFIDFLNPKTVLDYGCGKGSLINELKLQYPEITFYKYDPAIAEYNTLPVDTVDFLINTDVLEYIPEENIKNVIKNISSISQNCFFNLHHGAAMFILPNGTNAHCTIKPADWYHNHMYNHFKIIMPLKGRTNLTSAVITFGLTPDYVDRYYDIILNNTSSDNNVERLVEFKKNNNKFKDFIEFIFSIKNNHSHKIIKLFGLKISIKRGNL